MRLRRGNFCLAVLFAGCASMARAQAGAKLSLTLEHRIDGRLEDLSGVSFIAPFRDGEIAVGQPEDGSILFFSPDGRRLGAFGRSGAGPGEFRMVGTYGWVEDTLWIGDANLGRVTLLSSQRQLLRTLPWPNSPVARLPGEVSLPRFHSPRIFGISPVGNLILVGAISGIEQPGRWPALLRDMVAVAIQSAGDGTPIGFIAALPKATSCSMQLAGGAVGIPECAEPMWAVDRDGSRVTTVYPDVSDPGAGRLRVIVAAATGDTLFDHSFPIPLVRISPRQADSIRSRVSARSTDPARAIAWRSAALPSVFRPVKGVFIARNGAVWVEIRSSTASHSWLIVAPDGNSVRTLSVPRNVMLLTSDDQRVWGTEADQDGIESVVRYRLRF